MSNLRKAAEQALEALITAEAGLADIGDADREPGDDLAWCESRAAQALAKPRQAIAAIRAALEEPEQEPVAWMYTRQWNDERFITRYQSELTTYKADKVWPLYTAPPQHKPLTITEESAWDLARYVYARSNPQESPQILLSAMEIKQIIEAAHGIKGEA